MALRKIETKVGGAKWELMTLPSTTGLSCLTQISSIIGSPAGAAAAGIKKGSSALDLRTDLIGPAISKMMEKLAEVDTADLVKTLLTDLRKNDKPVEFDDEFSGDYGILMKLVAWSIRENFGSFLKGNPVLDGLVKKVQGSIQEVSTGG